MDQEDVVKWVASQSTNPALQALISEAERDRTSRPPWSPPSPHPSLSTRHHHPLALSTSIPPRIPARPPSSSNSTPKHVPRRDNEPEATAFIQLLKHTFRAVDENSAKKQRRDKELARTRPLTKSSSASAISSSKENPLSRGSPLAAFGKSTPASLSSQNLNRNLKHASAPPLSTRPSTHPTDTLMQDAIDLTDTDTDGDKPISRADTMDSDDQDSDTPMDVSFYKPEPPPPAPKQQSRPPPAPTQRVRTGPPPLGMRRAPQLPPSQYTSTQPSKSVAVPRFRPPLLTSASAATNRNGSVTKPPTTPRPPPPRTIPVTEITAQATQDPDSSFDVSFDMDADALEEAMKAYD